MNGMSLEINSDALYRALLEKPVQLERNMGTAIGRIVLEVARSARAKAPKAFSTLTHSIKSLLISNYEGIVAPGVGYAQVVEEGTRGGGMPPVQNILDWIKVKHITSIEPNTSQRDLAFMIARSIAIKGTPAQLYMAPALEEQSANAERRINAAIDAALAA
jgi:hypothetical protein